MSTRIARELTGVFEYGVACSLTGLFVIAIKAKKRVTELRRISPPNVLCDDEGVV